MPRRARQRPRPASREPGTRRPGAPPRSSFPGTALLRRLSWLGLAAAGLVAGGWLLEQVWPRQQADEVVVERNLQSLAKPPNRPVTLLVVGLDSDQLSPAASADALLLLRLNPGGPLQVLQVPANVAVQLPGQGRPQPLADLYRAGGPALLADAVRDLAGQPQGQPDRYLVVSRGALRELVDAIGSVEANPSRSMRYTDTAQDLTIDLQSGRQRLSGTQLEHLARWRDPGQPTESRLTNLEEVTRSLHRELVTGQARLDLVGLLSRFQGQLGTNLSRTEALGLLVVALDPATTLTVTTLPLQPPRPAASTKADLRERVAQLPEPFWPAPAAAP